MPSLTLTIATIGNWWDTPQNRYLLGATLLNLVAGLTLSTRSRQRCSTCQTPLSKRSGPTEASPPGLRSDRS